MEQWGYDHNGSIVEEGFCIIILEKLEAIEKVCDFFLYILNNFDIWNASKKTQDH